MWELTALEPKLLRCNRHSVVQKKTTALTARETVTPLQLKPFILIACDVRAYRPYIPLDAAENLTKVPKGRLNLAQDVILGSRMEDE
jgi:hypothetical protein